MNRNAYRWAKKELRALLELAARDETGDEHLFYRIQCLQADIFGYEAARAAIKRGDETMPANPYEQGVSR